MQAWTVPLSPRPEQFGITLGSVALMLRVVWRNRGGAGWVLDVMDGNEQPLVMGLPLIAGADLLGQHKHIGIPGELWIGGDDGASDVVPSFTNLGSDIKMYFVLR